MTLEDKGIRGKALSFERKHRLESESRRRRRLVGSVKSEVIDVDQSDTYWYLIGEETCQKNLEKSEPGTLDYNLRRLFSSRLLVVVLYNIVASKSTFTVTVPTTESAGRGVFATRAIGAGELIHAATPIVSFSLYNNECLLFVPQKSQKHNHICSQDCEEKSKIIMEKERPGSHMGSE
ncbi:uncharacterized protein LOC131326829 [Rhododendron vialii]|uniref:uncharacterized protein LOC131326829 n=1 Tax=Rhododendron vialii TaxID=182163 RepID=UPI0026603146|nr:uncharacterized protein LOC131326829 [Rhododendron vialii]